MEAAACKACHIDSADASRFGYGFDAWSLLPSLAVHSYRVDAIALGTPQRFSKGAARAAEAKLGAGTVDDVQIEGGSRLTPPANRDSGILPDSAALRQPS